MQSSSSGFASGDLTRSRPDNTGNNVYRNFRNTARRKKLNFPEPLKPFYLEDKVEVKQKGGLGRLQVFEVDGEKLWFVNDANHVCCMLLEEY